MNPSTKKMWVAVERSRQVTKRKAAPNAAHGYPLTRPVLPREQASEPREPVFTEPLTSLASIENAGNLLLESMPADTPTFTFIESVSRYLHARRTYALERRAGLPGLEPVLRPLTHRLCAFLTSAGFAHLFEESKEQHIALVAVIADALSQTYEPADTDPRVTLVGGVEHDFVFSSKVGLMSAVEVEEFAKFVSLHRHYMPLSPGNTTILRDVMAHASHLQYNVCDHSLVVDSRYHEQTRTLKFEFVYEVFLGLAPLLRVHRLECCFRAVYGMPGAWSACAPRDTVVESALRMLASAVESEVAVEVHYKLMHESMMEFMIGRGDRMVFRSMCSDVESALAVAMKIHPRLRLMHNTRAIRTARRAIKGADVYSRIATNCFFERLFTEYCFTCTRRRVVVQRPDGYDAISADIEAGVDNPARLRHVEQGSVFVFGGTYYLVADTVTAHTSVYSALYALLMDMQHDDAGITVLCQTVFPSTVCPLPAAADVRRLYDSIHTTASGCEGNGTQTVLKGPSVNTVPESTLQRLRKIK